MGDSAEEYLLLASKLNRKHFSHGYSSIRHLASESSGKSGFSKSDVTTIPQSSMRLPLKKRKRPNDDDDDDDGPEAKDKKKSLQVPSLSPEPSTLISTESSTATKEANTTKKISLMDKWFPGSTLNSATLDAAQAPRLETIDITVARIKAARERLVALRIGVEDVVRFAHLNTDGTIEDIEDTSEWDWVQLRTALSHFTSSRAFRYKRRIRQAVRWLFAEKPQTAVLRKPVQREWDVYLSEHGPELGFKPSLSLLLWLDSACTAALFSALVVRLMRGYKRGIRPPATSTTHATPIIHDDDDTHKTCSGDEDEVNEEGEEGTSGSEQTAPLKSTISPDLYTRLPPLPTESLGDDVRSLLWFLRYFMPVDVEDQSSNASNRTSGYGVWLYAFLSAVDTPLDPDLDRLVHELFRTCCRQIQTIGEAHGVRGDDRGAILKALSPRREFEHIQYNTIKDVRRDDVLALHTIIIVLTKLFRQNQNRLIPL